MERIFIKPRAVDGKKLKIVDPETGQRLAAEGEWKDRSMHWLRRLADQDVVEATPGAADEPAATPRLPRERKANS
jgi:hypothetical protein